MQEKYGIGLDEVEDLLAAQDYKCAICRRPEDAGGGWIARLHVDHSHATGKVRGLLCMHCNTAIGKFGDDPEVLKRALYYLTHY